MSPTGRVKLPCHASFLCHPPRCQSLPGLPLTSKRQKHTEPSGTGRQDAEEAAGWGRAERSGWWRLPRLTCQIRPALKGFKYGRRLLFHAWISLSGVTVAEFACPHTKCSWGTLDVSTPQRLIKADALNKYTYIYIYGKKNTAGV